MATSLRAKSVALVRASARIRLRPSSAKRKSDSVTGWWRSTTIRAVSSSNCPPRTNPKALSRSGKDAWFTPSTSIATRSGPCNPKTDAPFTGASKSTTSSSPCRRTPVMALACTGILAISSDRISAIMAAIWRPLPRIVQKILFKVRAPNYAREGTLLRPQSLRRGSQTRFTARLSSSFRTTVNAYD